MGTTRPRSSRDGRWQERYDELGDDEGRSTAASAIFLGVGLNGIGNLFEFIPDGRSGSRRSPPDAVWLFNNYLSSGYAAFSVLSELGSHAGFFHVTLFHLDPMTETVAVDFGGAMIERAPLDVSGVRAGLLHRRRGRPCIGLGPLTSVGCEANRHLSEALIG